MRRPPTAEWRTGCEIAFVEKRPRNHDVIVCGSITMSFGPDYELVINAWNLPLSPDATAGACPHRARWWRGRTPLGPPTESFGDRADGRHQTVIPRGQPVPTTALVQRQDDCIGGFPFNSRAS